MNGWIVLGSTLSDDVPLFLSAEEEPARAFAAAVTEANVADVLGRVLKREASEPFCVAVAQFVNGLPVAWHLIKELA